MRMRQTEMCQIRTKHDHFSILRKLLKPLSSWKTETERASVYWEVRWAWPLECYCCSKQQQHSQEWKRKSKQLPYDAECWLLLEVQGIWSAFVEANNQALWYRCLFTRNPDQTYQFPLQESPNTLKFRHHQQGFTLKAVPRTQKVFPYPQHQEAFKQVIFP